MRHRASYEGGGQPQSAPAAAPRARRAAGARMPAVQELFVRLNRPSHRPRAQPALQELFVHLNRHIHAAARAGRRCRSCLCT